MDSRVKPPGNTPPESFTCKESCETFENVHFSRVSFSFYSLPAVIGRQAWNKDLAVFITPFFIQAQTDG
jgi:hypothetical protein